MSRTLPSKPPAAGVPAAEPDVPADVAIERAMQQKPKAMQMREALQKLLENEDSARQLVGALRNMMNQS
ncbi:hypothetical protein [Azospirillum thermophilum]|uniref:Uncharacterized protein n=1 Tax=Azospirillum thermophilum TaxID=2202148 RepID=A0A2S2CNZ3_9PROT|nr:hypothetical protein [Azospirillum thermophilum]AWK86243.1 hypothetical protein DEW08_08260 [Azospirillum thermophilum]